jgi:hypothetical protein
MDLTTALIAVAVVAYLLVRRFLGEPLQARRLILPPLILIVWGGVNLSHVGSGGTAVHQALLDGVVVGFGAIVAVLGGVIRGLTVKVYVRDGHTWYRYGLMTVVVWLALIALRLGQSLAGHALGADQAVLNAALLLILGLSLLGEAAVVARRAIATGAPFAPRGSRRVAAGRR